MLKPSHIALAGTALLVVGTYAGAGFGSAAVVAGFISILGAAFIGLSRLDASDL